MNTVDTARIRADMKRNQYAEPEDTEALIIALDEARADVLAFAQSDTDHREKLTICRDRLHAEIARVTQAEAERDRLDLAHLAVAAKLRDRAEKAEAERDARGVMSDSLSKALAETREALAEVVEDLAAARAAVGRVEALLADPHRKGVFSAEEIRAALTPPAAGQAP